MAEYEISKDSRRGSDPIEVNNDEIELVCDLLWFAKNNGEPSAVAEALWQRLQPIRHGDVGATAHTRLSSEEARAVVSAGEFTRPHVPLDKNEAALVSRLRSLLE
jgi:hypothetical protein